MKVREKAGSRAGRRRTAALLVLLVSVLAAALVPSAPGQTFATSIKASKKGKDGPYTEGNIRVNVGDEPNYVHFKITNNSDHLQTVTLTYQLSGAASDYAYRWTRGDDNITPEVAGKGYSFELRKLGAHRGRSAVVRLRLKPLVANPSPVCVTPRVHTEPDNVDNHFSLYVNNNSICG